MYQCEFYILLVVREAISRLKRDCSVILMVNKFRIYKLQFKINMGGISL